MEKRDGELVNVYLYEFCHIVVGLEMENGEFGEMLVNQFRLSA
jgi:hypothetical protein